MPDHLHMGGCSCGRVRYRMLDKPLIVHACHCRMCQRLTGSTNAVNVLMEAENVELESGVVAQKLAFTPSGRGQMIARCADCNVAVWSDYLIFSELRGVDIRFIRAGTLDRPDRFPPDVHIFSETMQPHVQPGGDVPQYPQFYDLTRVWPKRSLARLAKANPSARNSAPG